MYWWIPVLYNITLQQKSTADQVIMTVLNSLIHFGALFAWLDTAGADIELIDSSLAIGFAIVYGVLAYLYYSKNSKDTPMLVTSLALSIGYLTLAIPFQFGHEWVPLLWTIEAAFLFGAGIYLKDRMIYRFALPVLVLAFLAHLSTGTIFIEEASGMLTYLGWIVLIGTLMVQRVKNTAFDSVTSTVAMIGIGGMLLLNEVLTIADGWYNLNALERFIQTGLLVGCCYFVLLTAKKHWQLFNEDQRVFFGITAIVTQIVTLTYLTHELYELLQYTMKQNFTEQVFTFGTSILWAAYATAALTIGFKHKYRFVRLFGIGLLLITVFKLVFVDLWALGMFYRIVGFVIIGVLLIGTSMVYQNNKNILSDVLGKK